MLKFILFLALGCLIIYAGLFWFLRNPVLSSNGVPGAMPVSAERLEADVRHLAASNPSRAFHNVPALDAIAGWIEAEFTKAGCRPYRQSYEVERSGLFALGGSNQYHNIICSFGPEDAPRLVIGGHYDVAGDNNPGADDNAGAVAAILELARLLGKYKPDLKHRIDLVAFTLEEPPNFRSQNMGSYRYAQQLSRDDIDIKLMISVEMIGYFSDEPGSQSYPVSALKAFYPSRGNFIGVIGKAFERRNVARVKELMMNASPLPVYSINSPDFVPGVDLSDHWGFWQHGLPAVMVTDTAFMRNPNYHQPTDTPDTLDFKRMAFVVNGLYRVATGF